MNKKFAVIFTVPVEIQVADGIVPNLDEVIKALTSAAYDKLQTRKYTPHIEELHEIVSEDENGSNPGLRNKDQGGSTHIHFGATGRKNADNAKDLHMDEQRKSEPNVSGEAGKSGGKGKNRKKDKRGIHFDKTG